MKKKGLLEGIGYSNFLVAICSETGDVRFQKVETNFQVKQFVNQWNINRKFNIYWQINPVKEEAKGKKASREDIKEVCFLFVDIDPKEGLTKDRIKILVSAPPKEVPSPSVIIDSGNGYQALWKLKEPSTDFERCERANRWLAEKLQADNCFDVSRCARLPNTINYPNEAKKKKGWTEKQAKIEFMNLEKVHFLDDFKESERKTLSKVEVLDIEPEDIDLKDLKIPRAIVQKIKTDTLQKTDINGKVLKDKFYNSRSEKLLGVVINLFAYNVKESQILSILLNEKYSLASHIMDHDKRQPVKYATRQIARGKAFFEELKKNSENALSEIEEKALEELGSYFILRASTQTIICHELNGDVRFLAKDSFLIDCADKYVFDEEKRINLGGVWLQSSEKRTYDGLIIKSNPTDEEKEKYFNMFKGLGIEGKKGEWKNIKSFIFEIICDSDKRKFEFITKLIAWKIQNPTERTSLALLLIGGQGCGKGVFSSLILGRIFTPHFFHITRSDDIIGRFNDFLKGNVYCFVDEVKFTKTEDADRLKALITEKNITIEPKGKSLITIPNSIFYVFASNREHSIRIEPDDRRFFICKVSSKQQKRKEYWKPLIENHIEKELPHFVFDMKNMKLGEFHPHSHAFDTKEKEDQKSLALNQLEQLIQSFLESGEIDIDGKSFDSGTGTLNFSASEFIENLKFKHKDAHNVGRNKIYSTFKKLGCEKIKKQNIWKFSFPNLKTMRENWDRVYFPINWDSEIASWGSDSVFEEGEATKESGDIFAPD